MMIFGGLKLLNDQVDGKMYGTWRADGDEVIEVVF
jgi:hypothetical protein